MNGYLFVFEGPDGIGKTSIINLIYHELISQEFLVNKYSFPGNEKGSLGYFIYNLYYNSSNNNTNKIDPSSLQLLHIAAHIDLIKNNIIPTLRANKIVLLDRYWWSTLIYGKIDNADENALIKMIEIEKFYWDSIIPDKLFLIKRLNIPLKSDIEISKWNKIKNEYDILMTIEKSKYPVSEIVNQNSLKNASDRCLEEIFEIIKK